MNRRIIVLLSAVLALLCTACDVGSNTPSSVNIPSNIAQVQSSPVGKALKPYGYLPVAQVTYKDKAKGVIYVDCGHERDLTKCAANMHNTVSASRPNVYVVDNSVISLEGSRVGARAQNYYLTVPKHYQQFDQLSKTKQQQLLGAMAQAQHVIGSSPTRTAFVLNLSYIGETDAYLH